jgi:hypothetical protein
VPETDPLTALAVSTTLLTLPTGDASTAKITGPWVRDVGGPIKQLSSGRVTRRFSASGSVP